MLVSSKLSELFNRLHGGVHLACYGRDSIRRYLMRAEFIAGSSDYGVDGSFDCGNGAIQLVDNMQGYRDLVNSATKFRDEFIDLIPELRLMTFRDIVDDYVERYSKTTYGVRVNE